jgi:hypothetical protein
MTNFAYPCADVPEVPQGNYSRLCPCQLGHWPPHDEAQLALLSESMKGPNPNDTLNSAQVMRSGYVYLGQFIDHDLTRDVALLDEAGPDTDRTLNYRTPRFDLNLLYGNVPAEVPCIYNSNGELKLGRTEASAGSKSTRDDLPRQPDGTAIVVDARSDENLAIAQMHVLFAKFHNRVLGLLKKRPDLSAGPSGASVFEQARRFVTWHYQWIVLNDFLPHIVQNATLRDIRENGLYLFPRAYTPADYPVSLPVEFTVAAFRFGHSMIRDSYFLNRTVKIVAARELIDKTKRGGEIRSALSADYVIDWNNHFFDGVPGHLNRAEPIDTFISEMLYDLPPQTVQSFRPQPNVVTGAAGHAKMKPPLPELTLKRGSRVRLPSGEEFARSFGFTPLDPDVIPARLEQKAFFEQDGFRGRTPLWFYLLREAAVEAVVEPEPEGRLTIQKLGTIGGRIVAEVFHQLLNADYNSIVHAGKNWRPPTFAFDASSEDRTLDSMQTLVDFASPNE